MLIEEINSDHVIKADSLVDLLIEEIDSDHVIEADSLANLLIKKIDSHRLVFVADSLNWSEFKLSQIKFDDTDYFDSTDSQAF